jgi:SRSO17 transposase
LKPQCTTAVARKITRYLNEDVRDRVVHCPIRKPSSSRAGKDAVLVIDDTAMPKKGDRSVGVASQYASSLGRRPIAKHWCR